jgi:hypothetical protein
MESTGEGWSWYGLVWVRATVLRMADQVRRF